MENTNQLGRLQGRSPAVDFIDNRLPQHDPAFVNAPSVFDNASGRYVPVLPDHLDRTSAGQSTITGVALRPQSPPGQVAVLDQVYQDVEVQSMVFWNDIFEEAMQIVRVESEQPKILTKLGGIRNASGWGGVCARLSEAKIAYTDEEGTSGMLKRMRRKVADNLSQPAAHIAKMVPDIDPWTTPVVGTIGLLLQAVSTAAKTRQEVVTSLSDLGKTFSNINSFAATFPKDGNVRQASVSLVVAIFQAVEQAMAFFVKSSGRKAAAAVLTGSDYQKELLNSFNEVQRRSNELIQKAQNCHFSGTKAAMLEILSREDRLLSGQAEAVMHSGEAAKNSADAKNSILCLLEVYARNRELDRKEHQEELRRRDAIQKQQDAIHRRDRQELLALVHQLQITPRPVSPFPVTLALPPPSISSANSVAIPHFPVWSAQTLLQLLGVPDVSVSDLQRVKELDCTLSKKDKSKADRIVQKELFGQWIRSLKPAKLLVQGDFRGVRAVSPLSLLTATLIEAALAGQHSFVSLVFFCGCHLDPEEDTFVGSIAMIQVFISQLLQQLPHINISPSPGELNMDEVREGNSEQLCQLLKLLVRRLPGEITLFCLIDGMVYYERDEFIGQMQVVLTTIIGLVGDPTVQANVKLLITSPWRTAMAQQFFQEDHEILHMGGMPSAGLTPRASGVVHRHVSHTASDQSSRDSSPEL